MRYLQHLIEVELEARNFGFDWPNFQMIIDQAIDECREIREALDQNEPTFIIQEEIGDLLQSAISMCIYKELDLEETLNIAYEKFKRRIEAIKYLSAQRGYKTLKNEPFEILLELWHEAKNLQYLPPQIITIRAMNFNDTQQVMQAFANIGWNKPVSLFENYLNEQSLNERKIWVAFYNNHFAGYVTLKWQSNYKYFLENNIPEIKDLNVLPVFRNNGIGSRLIDECEKTARHNGNSIIGIGVGLYADYGNAQKLYIRKGYMPDGNGITYNDVQVKYGENIPLDDDLALCFIKDIK